jgi:pSer/pThr/pTyr-binding forkhead associated (FHA) protein
MTYLLRIFEVRKGQRIEQLAKDSAFVGRDPKRCDVVLDALDTLASRVHLEISRDGDFYHLKDLSKNGTWVGGERVAKAGRRLYHGDCIEAGNAEITFFVCEHSETAAQLFDIGQASEALEPWYAIQCYALAHRQCPQEVKYAAWLLSALERQDRTEDLVTGGNYFDQAQMWQLATNAEIAVPIARALVRLGDFPRAIELMQRAGGPSADREVAALMKSISNQAGDEVLTTALGKPSPAPFFERGNLRIYVDDRADFADLRYVERYHKYLQHSLDGVFGGPPSAQVVFHIAAHDHLFGQSSPNQTTILGYYSHASKRIFIRPRRCLTGSSDERFHITLMHEYVHFRIHEICDERWVPRWYDEGLAQVLSEGILPADLASIAQLKRKCKHIWALSDATFCLPQEDLRVAYLQAHAILSYLVQQFGKQEPLRVLRRMVESGMDFQASLRATLGISLEELDERWWSVVSDEG